MVSTACHVERLKKHRTLPGSFGSYGYGLTEKRQRFRPLYRLHCISVVSFTGDILPVLEIFKRKLRLDDDLMATLTFINENGDKSLRCARSKMPTRLI